jgi:hypothetical protein
MSTGRDQIGSSRSVNQGFIAALAFAALVGGFLRLYLLSDQVVIDDEWHGLYYVLGKSPGWLLTHFSIPGATCIPLNLYAWALLHSFGWSETLLRLPSLVGGLLCVILTPVAARKLIGSRPAALLGLLLAFSPLLIFYSRLCRPYSCVALLGFAAILLTERWRRTGGGLLGLLALASGSLAIYFHLFAAVAVAAPILVGVIASVRQVRTPSMSPSISIPSPRQWLLFIALLGLLTSLLVLPALIDSVRSTFFKVALSGSLDLRALPQAALLITGTGQPVLAGLFWIALVTGAVSQCRRDPWFGATVVSLYPLHVLALLISRPDSAQAAIVLVRYSIPLVPVSLLLVACGIFSGLESLERYARLRPTLQMPTAVAFVLALAVAGPLAQCYVRPNTFTSHGAYQHHYDTIKWDRSFVSDFTPRDFPLTTTIGADEVSPFYSQLGQQGSTRPIVEYPMLVGDHFNPHYYYQHFHKRPVLIGYTTDMKLSRGLAAGNIYGNTYVDQVLSLVPTPSSLRFHSMVPMDDLADMRAHGVEYVVLHKKFEAQLPAVAPAPPALGRLECLYRKELGQPAYEDGFITAFRL